MDAAVDPDAMLMLAYARGDLAAFEALYARHRGMLYRFLLRSVRDPHRSDELFQETWSRVISARARYQPQAKFSTWLLQIAQLASGARSDDPDGYRAGFVQLVKLADGLASRGHDDVGDTAAR